MNRPHTHPDIEINFVITGSIRYFLAGRFIDINAGETAIFWGGGPHQTLARTANVEGIWLTLPLLWLLRWRHTREMAEHLLKGEVLHFPSVPEDEPRFTRWLSDYSSDDPRLREILVREIEVQLSRRSIALAPAAERPKRIRLSEGCSRIEHILGYLAAHYLDDFTVEDVANAVRLHPKYLLTLFRQTCQMTLWEYVVRLRLGHVQRLLLTTDRTVTDIAFDAGFNSLSAFYHAFRRHVPARTPAAFRSSFGL